MNPPDDRRSGPRQALDPPEVAVLHGPGGPALPQGRLFVDLLERSEGGVRVRSTRRLAPGTRLQLQLFSPAAKAWETFPAEVLRDAPDPARPRYR